MVAHEVPPLRRRRPTPAPRAKSVGRLRAVDFKTTRQPLRRGRAGSGRPRRRDHGVTHAAMPETMERAHATMELHTPMPVGGRRSGLRMEYKLLLVLLCQACATAVKGAWGRGAGGGGEREERERERRDESERERIYNLYPMHSLPSNHPRGPLEVQLLSTRRTQTGPQCPETVRKSSSEWTSLSSAQPVIGPSTRSGSRPLGVRWADTNRTSMSGNRPEVVRPLDARRTVSGH